MNKIFNLTLRNLTRQKRRNLILAVAIAFGFFVVTVIDGLTSGMVENLEEQITQLTGGSVLIQGYEKIPPSENNKKSTLLGIIRDKDYILDTVNTLNIDCKYYSRYSTATGQMIFEGKKSMIQVYGYDLSDSYLAESFSIISGSRENFSDPKALVISEKTANSMNLEVGDVVTLTAITLYGQNNVEDFKIAAIIKSNSFVNAMMSYANIESVNSLVGIPEGGYSTFSIFLKNKNNQAKVAKQIEEKIRSDGKNVSSIVQAAKTNPGNIGRGIEKQFTSEDEQWSGVKYGVSTLYYEIPAIKTVLSVVHIITTVILLVILLIVMIGVSNTYRLVLYERIREIGTMRALGMSGRDTGKTFTLEAVVLCLFGALCGFILAVIAMFIVHLVPIPNETISFFLYKGHFSFKLSPFTVLLQYVLLVLLTLTAVHGSAKKAARLSPAEALRTVK